MIVANEEAIADDEPGDADQEPDLLIADRSFSIVFSFLEVEGSLSSSSTPLVPAVVRPLAARKPPLPFQSRERSSSPFLLLFLAQSTPSQPLDVRLLPLLLSFDLCSLPVLELLDSRIRDGAEPSVSSYRSSSIVSLVRSSVLVARLVQALRPPLLES
jgi:hypothetical protein